MAGKTIYLSEGERFNAEALRGMTEERAVHVIKGHSKNQVIKAWKIANGKSKPNNDPYKKPEPKKKDKNED